MDQTILAYDFGTGGTEASLYDKTGECLASDFASYETFYPQDGWHEQRPADWWRSVVESTRKLFADGAADKNTVAAIGISGHSLGLVPLDSDGRLLRDQVPIWSDSRPDSQVPEFFRHIAEEEWYLLTGNGFPPALYTVFKIMWLRDNEPDTFTKIHQVVGTKDYVNFRMTGVMATDHSYASGSGVYDLKGWKYSDQLIAASGLPAEILPKIVPSTEVLGTLLPEAAAELGLPESVRVVAGGVVHMTRTLAAEWGRFNINVNCFSPSYILSPMHASTPLEARQRIRELTPLGYMERPEDLHGTIIFLASAASNYVTGHDLMVDGGHTLNSWLVPLTRDVPPRISPEQEVVQLKQDLADMGVEYDENGINQELHPEIADAFKGMLGLE